LEAILKSPCAKIILIDDARLYTGENGWPELKTIQQLINEAHPDWGFEVKDDIIRTHPVNGFISMTTLGQFGQYGNQLFQYAAMKAYARENNLRLEIPEDWIGRKILLIAMIRRLLVRLVSRKWLKAKNHFGLTMNSKIVM